jgi:fructosamine-3-kinase
LLSNIDPPLQPVILHGDLWSGNVGLDSKSRSPVIFDPASYYGHNEADLGITHMFGGEYPWIREGFRSTKLIFSNAQVSHAIFTMPTTKSTQDVNPIMKSASSCTSCTTIST